MEGECEGDKIKVVVRVRPLLERETPAEIHWKVVDENTIANEDEKIFTFDHVYREIDLTENVYSKSAKEVVDSAMAGYNGTIFAYGQTASGKTHTMFGTDNRDGIVHMALGTIFSKIAESSSKRYMLRMSCIEIYNEKVRDLLSDTSADLPVKEYKQKTVVDGLREEVIVSNDGVQMLIQKAFDNRIIGETALNKRSSRSHVILRFIVECYDDDISSDTSSYISFLNIVDLAGSENVKRSGAEGDRLKEGGLINTSLLALQKVINQLSEKNGHGYVNFRDSKLTRLLKSSLGGNARTLIICTVSSIEATQTLHTLGFAARAKKIMNKPHKNRMTEGMLTQYIRTIERLKAELEENRKSETVERELINKNNELSKEVERLRKCILTSQILSQPAQKSNACRARRQTWGGIRAGPCIDEDSPFRLDTAFRPYDDFITVRPKISAIEEELSEQQGIENDFDASVVAFTTLQIDDEKENNEATTSTMGTQCKVSGRGRKEEIRPARSTVTRLRYGMENKKPFTEDRNVVSAYDLNRNESQICSEKEDTGSEQSNLLSERRKHCALEAANVALQKANERLMEENKKLMQELCSRDRKISWLEKNCDDDDNIEAELREQLYELHQMHEKDLSVTKHLRQQIAELNEALTERRTEDVHDKEELVRLQMEMRRKEQEFQSLKGELIRKDERISRLTQELRRLTNLQESCAFRKENDNGDVEGMRKSRYVVELPPARTTPVKENPECRTQ